MSRNKYQLDWDPRAASVLENQLAAYDEMRARSPVAYSDYLQWSLFRHEDVKCVLEDHDTFSNVASRHLSVPNAMDPPEHTRFRRIIDPYFGPEAMAEFEPKCRAIAENIAARLPHEGEIEAMSLLGQDFALEIQCAFMGWPASLYEPLRKWTRGHHAATLAADRKALSELALRFDTLVSNLLAERRAAGTKRVEDVTSRLMVETVEGRNLTDEEITSILRNWTVGELGTISACVGILLHYLAEHTTLQQRLRAEPKLLPAAIDEILRMDAPLLTNRRVTTCPTKIGDRELDAGERLTIMWGSANRDEKVFGDPDEFRLDRNPQDNLLYGAGIHVCPGAPLARMELLFFVEALLSQTTDIQAVTDKPAVRAHYPTGGYSTVPLYVKC